VHIHVAAMGQFKRVAPFLLFLFRRQPKYVTLHSGTFVREFDHFLSKIYLREMVKHLTKIIAVNLEQYNFLRDNRIPTSKLALIPAFIPAEPVMDLPPEILRKPKPGNTVVVTSGYLSALYNYDVLIDCIERLDEEVYTFIFAFYNKSDQEYEEHILGRLRNANNVVIFRDQTPEIFLSILNVTNIYVRTTVTDGDAVAIREALYLGKNVFASDCVEHPQGCVLFDEAVPESLLRLFIEYDKNPHEPEPSHTITNGLYVLRAYLESV